MYFRADQARKSPGGGPVVQCDQEDARQLEQILGLAEKARILAGLASETNPVYLEWNISIWGSRKFVRRLSSGSARAQVGEVVQSHLEPSTGTVQVVTWKTGKLPGRSHKGFDPTLVTLGIEISPV